MINPMIDKAKTVHRWMEGMTTTYTGRNGVTRCGGIEVEELSGIIEIAPHTGKGKRGRNTVIQIPKNAHDLDWLINRLNEIRKGI